MNTQMTLQTRPQTFTQLAAATRRLALQATLSLSKLTRISLSRLTRYYAQVLDRPLDNRHTLALLEAQAAFFLGMMPAYCPLLIRVALLVWATLAVVRCKRLLNENS